MEIYRDMDQKKYWRISIADTQKIDKQDMKVEENALSEEVLAEQSYVKKLIESLIGRVIKCETIDELRNCRTGITPDGMLYKNFQLKTIRSKTVHKKFLHWRQQFTPQDQRIRERKG